MEIAALERKDFTFALETRSVYQRCRPTLHPPLKTLDFQAYSEPSENLYISSQNLIILWKPVLLNNEYCHSKFDLKKYPFDVQISLPFQSKYKLRLMRIITSLKTNKAPGNDDFLSLILKNISRKPLVKLTNLINS